MVFLRRKINLMNNGYRSHTKKALFTITLLLVFFLCSFNSIIPLFNFNETDLTIYAASAKVSTKSPTAVLTPLPTKAATSVEPVVYPYRKGMVSAGLVHTVLLNESGFVYSWGDNSYGQLGTGTTDKREAPAQIKELTDIVMISAGAYHNLALSRDGSVYAWGRNTFGQIGNNMTETALRPVKIPNLPVIKEISAGAYHSLAVSIDGKVYGWGNNTSGQVGYVESQEIIGESQNIIGKRVLMPVVVVTEGAQSVSGGGNHSLYLDKEGNVFSWGDNASGQLGDGTVDSRSVPVKIEGLSSVIMISAGYAHNLCVKETKMKISSSASSTVDDNSDYFQNLYVWGSDSVGQLGLGGQFDENHYVETPQRVDTTKDMNPENDRISLIKAGYFSSCITIPVLVDSKERNRIAIWGNNKYGQLGIGDLPSQNSPVYLVGTSNGWTGDNFLPLQSIALGEYHMVLLSVKGFVGAVGRADKGQLGYVSIIDRNTPVGISVKDSISPEWQKSDKLIFSTLNDELKLSWKDARDNIKVVGYSVKYKDKSGKDITISAGDVNDYTIKGLDLKSSQTIIVSAIDAAGNKSLQPLKYNLNTKESPIADIKKDNPLVWTPENYGLITVMEVPWNVDYIYGKGVVLPPKDNSWITAIVITLVVFLLIAFLASKSFRKTHTGKRLFKDVKLFKNIKDKGGKNIKISIDKIIKLAKSSINVKILNNRKFVKAINSLKGGKFRKELKTETESVTEEGNEL